jgi:hypothetical protein
MVTNRMRAFPMYRPPLVPSMGPQMLPPVPPPAPPPAAAAPNGASVAATQVPSSAPAGAMHGSFGGAGFGSTGGVQKHFHVDPYMVMRSGWMAAGVHPSASNIRSGVRGAGAQVHRSMPFQTAPLPELPPPPPPPAAAPIPAAVHGFGRPMHQGGGRRRHWASRLLNPETVAEVQSREASNPSGCETYPPRADGIKVTVCNGRVVKYEDAQGNVNTPDPNSGVEYGAGSGSMAGFGFPGWGQQHRGGRSGGGFHHGYGAQPAYAAQQPGAWPAHRHRWWEHQQQQQPAYAPPGSPPGFSGW